MNAHEVRVSVGMLDGAGVRQVVDVVRDEHKRFRPCVVVALAQSVREPRVISKVTYRTGMWLDTFLDKHCMRKAWVTGFCTCQAESW